VINFHALGVTTVAGLGSISFDRPRAIGLQLQPPPDTTAVTDTATGQFCLTRSFLSDLLYVQLCLL